MAEQPFWRVLDLKAKLEKTRFNFSLQKKRIKAGAWPENIRTASMIQTVAIKIGGKIRI